MQRNNWLQSYTIGLVSYSKYIIYLNKDVFADTVLMLAVASSDRVPGWVPIREV